MADNYVMQSGLTAQEERAFAAIISELEPKSSQVRLWHLLALTAAWGGAWAALLVFVEPVLVAFTCFVAIAAISAVGIWALRQVTTESGSWDRTLPLRDRFKLLWANLTD